MGVAVVSGGASGIGLALCEAFGQRGAHLIVADLNEEILEQAVERLRAGGIAADGYLVDLRDLGAVRRLADFALTKGSLEVVCLNAGVSYSGLSVWDTPPSIWEFTFNVNCFALVNQLTAFVPVLIGQGTPADVVITASLAGTIGMPTSAAYAASKAATVSIAKSLRGELVNSAPFVKVALLNPGMVRTNLQKTSSALQPADVEVDEAFVDMSHTSLNAMGASPDVVAEWVLDALNAGRFWIFPPNDDPYLDLLKQEITELAKSVTIASE